MTNINNIFFPVANIPAITTPPKTGSIKITVENICSEDPVGNVTISIGSKSKETNDNGLAIFNNVIAGTQNVMLNKEYPEAHYKNTINIDVLLTDAMGFKKIPSVKKDILCTVGENQETIITTQIEVYRTITDITFKRINPTKSPGHWWVEVLVKNNNKIETKAFGWYPEPYNPEKGPSPPSPPIRYHGDISRPITFPQAELANLAGDIGFFFRKIGHSIEKGFDRLIYGGKTVAGGVPGSVNKGLENDPRRFDTGDKEYHPVIDDCRTDNIIKECIITFATTGFKNNEIFKNELYSIVPLRQCHTFQLQIIKHCNLKKLQLV